MNADQIRAIKLDIIEPLPAELKGEARKEAALNIEKAMNRLAPNLNEAKFIVLREIAAQLAEQTQLMRAGALPPDVFVRRKIEGEALRLKTTKSLPSIVVINEQEYLPK